MSFLRCTHLLYFLCFQLIVFRDYLQYAGVNLYAAINYLNTGIHRFSEIRTQSPNLLTPIRAPTLVHYLTYIKHNRTSTVIFKICIKIVINLNKIIQFIYLQYCIANRVFPAMCVLYHIFQV